MRVGFLIDCVQHILQHAARIALDREVDVVGSGEPIGAVVELGDERRCGSKQRTEARGRRIVQARANE